MTDAGEVVGFYAVGDVVKGFVYRGGEFTTVEYPGAVVTHVTDMAADGTLVGSYRRPGDPDVAWHAFLRRPSGEFVDVRHPAQPYSMAQRLLADGTIVGCYHGADYTTTMRAMTVSGGPGGRAEVRDVPGAMYTGGTPDGRTLVGILAGERHAFVAEGGRTRHLEAPGGAATEAWDVNAAGTIVGIAVDSAQRSRGFVLERGRWTTLQAPGAQSTGAFGVNARGAVVGVWEDSAKARRAFLATRS